MGWNERSQIGLLLLLLNPFLMLSPLAAVQQITNPRIVEHPEDKYVGRSDAVTLNCKAEGDPPPIITWYRNGEPVVTTIENPLSHRMLLPSGQLFFLRVIHSKTSRSDVGTYYCNATNPLTGVSSISQNASLQIAMIRDEFREQPHNTNRIVGDDVVLQCRPPRGDPEPRVQWKKNGTFVSNSNRFHVQEDGSLLIRNSEKSDAGMYSCVAQNIGGQRESKPARLSILEKPKIVEAPTDEVVSEHGDAVFDCRATGDPDPVITWKKQKGTIPDQRSKSHDNGQSLRIRKVKVQDEGIYVCRVENSVGWQEAEARLSVHVQPSFITTPYSKSVALGRRVSFECVASGNPVPAIFWKKEDSPGTLMFPENSYGRFMVREVGTLVVDQVQKEDAGMFICQAQSVAGSAVAKAALTVKDMDSRPPPIIRHGLQNQTLPTKSTATLQCLTSGDPVPTVRWYKNNRVLDVSDQRITVLESGTLQINELHLTDTGWYTCKAISETGETSWSGALVIEPPTDTSVIFRRTPEPSTYPGAPSKPQVIDTKENSVKLSWKPNPNNGASQVSSYMVEYFSHETGEGWIVASDSIMETSYIVTGLQPDTSYRFLVRAQNSHGISLPSQVTGIVRTRGESLSLGNSSPVELDPDLIASKLSTPIVYLTQPDAITATTVHLRWEVRKSHRYVEGFHVKYCTVQNDDDIDQGHDLQPASCAIQTIQNMDARTHVLKDLEENTQYMIYVQPFFQLKEGAASRTILAYTLEDVPTAPPSNIQAIMSDNETLLLSWQAPLKRHQNGVITGYKIYLNSNNSQFSQDFLVNSSVIETAIQNLPKDIVYYVQIAATTKIGEGVRSEEIVVGHPVVELGQRGIESQPWFLAAVIICAGGSIWLLVCIIIICLYRRKGKQHVKYTNGQKKQMDLVAGHHQNSKEDRQSSENENLYENISSVGAGSTTKAAYDGSSLTSQPNPDSKVAPAFDVPMGRRPLPPDLEPFCQAYMIKPKPAVGGSAVSCGARPVHCDSLKVTANNGYNLFLQNSSALYASLRRPVRSNNPSSVEDVCHHQPNIPHFFPGSTFVQYPNYGTHQRSSVYYSDSDYLPGYSTSGELSDGCGIMPCNVFQPISAVGVTHPNPGYRNEYSLNAASEPEPYSSVGKLHTRSNGGNHRYFSDNEGLMNSHKESFYHNPPSPAPTPGENGARKDSAKSSLMQNGHASAESHED